MDTSKLLPLKSTLVGFSVEQVQVLGHLSVMTIYESGSNTKGIKVRYLIVNASSPYNIIIGRLTFNILEAVLSTFYLTMKYPIDGGHVKTIKDDQRLARKCYKDNLKLKKKILQEHPVIENTLKINLLDLDHCGDPTDNNLTPIGEVEKVQVDIENFQVTQMGLCQEEEEKMVKMLRYNADFFAWRPSDLPEIDPNVVCHHLSLDPSSNVMAQTKRTSGEEKKEGDHKII